MTARVVEPRAIEIEDEGAEASLAENEADADPDGGRPRGEPHIGVHDRTHLEFTLDYGLRDDARTETFLWEAYFFTPESLRVSSRTYQKQDLYADLQSYVRFAVPRVPFEALARAPIDRLRRAIASREEARIMRELRLVACIVRESSVETRRRLLAHRGRPSVLPAPAGEPLPDLARITALIEEAERLTRALREVLEPARAMSDPVSTGACWIDEDVSRVLESLFAGLALDLREEGAPDAWARCLEEGALREARYRAGAGIGGVGRIDMRSRELEHLEYRRHVLKRFAAAVLWLEPEVKSASTGVLHFFYAIAASVAMSFALVAALWGPGSGARGADAFVGVEFFEWVVVVILAYAAKDRIKALLQVLFQNVVAKHFPDRSWRILDARKKHQLASMEEQSGFVSFAELPREVLEMRRATHLSRLDEDARPETVLFHKKTIEVNRALVQRIEPDFDALTEIFRIDVRRWLLHTDEPKQRFVFADPEANAVARASAPRVYNVSIIYRLRRVGDTSEGAERFRRIRVVVTRKGIRRIEPIA